MGFVSGIVDVGENVTFICAVPESGIRIRNVGADTPAVYLGGAGVTAGGGYLLEPGAPSEQILGVKAKEAPIVPAPAGDAGSALLYGVTDAGSGTSRVSWIAA
jgi:hypothetical protein